LLCWLTGGLFLCLSPFLWGNICDLSAGPLLSACCNGLLIIFNFAVSFNFGCFSLSQEMSFVDRFLLYFRQQLSLACCWPFCISSLCLLKVCVEISSFCCVLVFSSFFIVGFFFFLHGGGLSTQEQCWFIPRVAGGILHDPWCSPVDLPKVSQPGLEPVSGNAGALLFFQYNVAWRSFVRAKSSGCQSFDSPWCSISAKYGFSVSAIFLIYGTHTASAP
jgi:hypothetical protein